LDSGIASAQTNLLAFLQSRISMLIDFLWNILNKTPINIRSAGEVQSGQGYGVASLESMKGLWTAYSPAVFGGLSKLSSKSPDAAAKTYASGAEVNRNGGPESKFAEPVPDPAMPAAH
jgi:receptor expression-enhancing protein 1/2/3/4